MLRVGIFVVVLSLCVCVVYVYSVCVCVSCVLTDCVCVLRGDSGVPEWAAGGLGVPAVEEGALPVHPEAPE